MWSWSGVSPNSVKMTARDGNADIPPRLSQERHKLLLRYRNLPAEIALLHLGQVIFRCLSKDTAERSLMEVFS